MWVGAGEPGLQEGWLIRGPEAHAGADRAVTGERRRCVPGALEGRPGIAGRQWEGG